MKAGVGFERNCDKNLRAFSVEKAHGIGKAIGESLWQAGSFEMVFSKGAIKSDDALLRALAEAALRGPSEAEIRMQKVSFIVSNLSDEQTAVTAAQVERELDRLAGKAA